MNQPDAKSTPSDMPNNIIYFFTPPKLESDQYFQNAFSMNDDGSLIALATDSSSSSLSDQKGKNWMNSTVEEFCRYQGDFIEEIYNQWEEWWGRLNSLTSMSQKHIFYAFIGLKFHNYNNKLIENLWEAIMVGDICLFQLKQDSGDLELFQAQNSELISDTFQNLPIYTKSTSHRVFFRGCYEEGDVFLVANNTLAKWLLANIENRSSEGKAIFKIVNYDGLARFIKQLTSNNHIRDEHIASAIIQINPVHLEPTKSDRESHQINSISGSEQFSKDLTVVLKLPPPALNREVDTVMDIMPATRDDTLTQQLPGNVQPQNSRSLSQLQRTKTFLLLGAIFAALTALYVVSSLPHQPQPAPTQIEPDNNRS